MKLLRHSLGQFIDQILHDLRISLSRPDALFQLAILGLTTGLFSGVVIVAFRLIVEGLQMSLLPGGPIENYEALPLWLRICLPILGGIFIALFFKLFARGENIVGVVHVLERLAYHQGQLSARGLVSQFIGAGIAIISGYSVGREGPSVHLGAASSSLIGQKLSLPHNTLRTLVGCGSAAAIAASFNTPLAGVIFSLEVIMMEYTIASFTPVILAAVSATTLTQTFYGTQAAFSVPPMELASLMELPYLFLASIVIGAASAVFIWMTRKAVELSKPLPFWSRIYLAGLLTGLCAAMYPQIMGIGYETVTNALLGELGLEVLIGIILFKMLATTGAIGFGVPGGIIGPTLFIGAAIGAMLGLAAPALYSDESSHIGLYALLGMGAMMGATLQAPLSALTAIFELTRNPNIMLPGMLMIVVANLTTGQLFNQRSIFTTLMNVRGLDYRHDPVIQAMRRVGVASIMNRRVQRYNHLIERDQAKDLLSKQPNWIVVDIKGQSTALLPALDLVRYLHESDSSKEPANQSIDLLQIPAKRLQVASIHLQATVDEALENLNKVQAEAVCVTQITVPGIQRIYGVVTKQALESSYRL